MAVEAMPLRPAVEEHGVKARRASILAFFWMMVLACPAMAQAPATDSAPAAEQQAPSAPQRLFTDGLADEQKVLIGGREMSPDQKEAAYLFQVELSNRGAAVNTVKLAEHFVTVADKKRYREDPATYPQAVAESPGKYQGHYSLLNPVGTGAVKHLPLATRLVRLQAAGEDTPVTINLDQLYWRPLAVEAGDDWQQASFEITVFRGTSLAKAKPLAKFVKAYRVIRGDYSVHMSLTAESLAADELRVTMDQAGPTGLPLDDIRSDLRQAAYANLQSKDQKVQNRLKSAGQVGKLAVGVKEWLGTSDGKDPVLWVGQINKFFSSMMYLQPDQPAGNWLGATNWQGKFYVEPVKETAESTVVLTGVELTDVGLRPGQSKTAEFDVFAGPKKRELFADERAPHHRKLYHDLKYIGTIDFGGCPCAFNWLALAMMWLLEVLSKVALGNYGVAIIILVLLVRLAVHPLTKKSQVSMMGMQKLTPKVQQLKEKYADNKEALNREMAKLYKEMGPAQLMGCLPMLLQMPILISLYNGINASVELRHAAFLPVWITDLAAPDALFTLPWSIPYVGDTFNLLPLLLCVAMYLQMKYSPQASGGSSTPEQAQQQKMMKFMMPIMMLVLFYKMPSGLTLYFMASTFAGLVDQHFVRKHVQRKEAEAAAEQTLVRVPGKAQRTSRAKKPKGPFWMKRG